MKMPKELRDKWVSALRSGEYVQGTGALYNPRDCSYCCLGVLEYVCEGACEKAASEEAYGSYLAVPSDEFYERNDISLLDDTGATDDDIIDDLVLMNDGSMHSRQVSFENIASFIENTVETY
jgi:hypothetical protein